MQDLISVILPVFNGEKYVGDAIDSILRQTHTELELIVIDDASTDRTREILRSYNDSRMRVLYNENNCGIVFSLNRGLDACKGKYVARMDADDVAMPNRLAEQLRYMKMHPEIIVESCWFEMFGAVNTEVRYPESHNQIFSSFLFGNRFLHPGYFMNNDLLKEYNIRYREDMKYAEDYDFAVRAGMCGKLANVPQILMRYRVHESQTTSIRKPEQKIVSQKIHEYIFSKLNVRLSDDEFQVYENVCCMENYQIYDDKNLNIAFDIYRRILEANHSCRLFDDISLEKQIAMREYLTLRYAYHYNKISRKLYRLLAHQVCDWRLKLRLAIGRYIKRKGSIPWIV